MNRLVSVALLIGLSLPPAAALALPAPSPLVRRVAASGQPAPGTTRTFGTFISSPPSVNIHGDVAFRANFAHQGPEGIWAEHGAAGLQAVAINGQPAVGIPGRTFNYFGDSNAGQNAAESRVLFNNAGQIAFRATLDNPSGVFNNDGIWLAQPRGALQLIARSGTRLPGSTRSVMQFQQDNGMALNQMGRIAFTGRLSATTNDAGLWFYSVPGGVPFKIAETGDPVPGSTTSERYREVAFDGPVLGGGGPGGSGAPYFKASIGDPFGNFTGDTGVFRGVINNTVVVARDDQTVPGLPAPGVLTGVFPFDVAANSAGTAAFAASFNDTQVGLFTAPVGGPIVPRALRGGPAPGVPTGIFWQDFHSPEINAGGRLAVHALVNGPGTNGQNNSGIWAEDAAGNLQLIAREGDPIPGGGGLVFGGSGDVFSEVAINARGQVAFMANVTNPGSSSVVARGIWATTVAGALTQIVRSGVDFETSGGLVRHSFFRFAGDTGNDEGRASGFSDEGHVAFHGIGLSTEAMYVSSAVAVPEPAAWALALVVGGATFRRRRAPSARQAR
jgi:hypothetical protein